MLDILKYNRKSFPVEAVLVTEENMSEVARWCKGRVKTTDIGGQTVSFIKVRVPRSTNERQTQAFVGDRVLCSDKKTFKVYTASAFENNFELVSE